MLIRTALFTSMIELNKAPNIKIMNAIYPEMYSEPNKIFIMSLEKTIAIIINGSVINNEYL